MLIQFYVHAVQLFHRQYRGKPHILATRIVVIDIYVYSSRCISASYVAYLSGAYVYARSNSFDTKYKFNPNKI